MKLQTDIPWASMGWTHAFMHTLAHAHPHPHPYMHAHLHTTHLRATVHRSPRTCTRAICMYMLHPRRSACSWRRRSTSPATSIYFSVLISRWYILVIRFLFSCQSTSRSRIHSDWGRSLNSGDPPKKDTQPATAVDAGRAPVRPSTRTSTGSVLTGFFWQFSPLKKLSSRPGGRQPRLTHIPHHNSLRSTDLSNLFGSRGNAVDVVPASPAWPRSHQRCHGHCQDFRRQACRCACSSRRGCFRSDGTTSGIRQGRGRNVVHHRGRKLRSAEGHRFHDEVLLRTVEVGIHPAEALVLHQTAERQRPLPGDQGSTMRSLRTPTGAKAGRSTRTNRHRQQTPQGIRNGSATPGIRRFAWWCPQTHLRAVPSAANRHGDYTQPRWKAWESHRRCRQGLDGVGGFFGGGNSIGFGPIFGKNAKISSRDQNLAEKAKFKKPHEQDLSY